MPIIEPRRPRQRGFTYLWVLLLVAFLGVGLTAAVQIDATAAQREREQELLAIGRQFQTALGRYVEQRPGGVAERQYPATLDELLQDPRWPSLRRHLRKIFVDPMTGKAEWGLVLVGGRIAGVHSLSDRQPIKQDGFAPEQAGLRGKQKYSEWLFVYPPDLQQQGAPGAPGAVPAAANPPTTGELK